MIISHKHKFIFLANGKCGTTSMVNKLKKLNEEKLKFKKHANLQREYDNKKINFDCSDYFVFCFVRNPWDRALSIYKQLQKPLNLSGLNRNFLYNLSTTNSFTDFIKKLPEEFFKNWRQSKYYLLNDEPIDFIGRFENIQHDFNIVCDKIGIKRRELPRKNKSKHKNYTEYYDDETRDIVAKEFAKDIEYFGYEFGE